MGNVNLQTEFPDFQGSEIEGYFDYGCPDSVILKPGYFG